MSENAALTARVDVWERRSEWPLAALAVAFFAVYAIPIIDTGLSDGARRAFHVASLVLWAAFAVDFAVRLWLARCWRYFWTHTPDLAMIALPMLRPLRTIRVLLLIRVLNRRAANTLHGRVGLYVVFSFVVLLFTAALAELDAERGQAGSNINGFGDALWWSMTTVSTVGYGDRYPVTAEGRFVAAALMLGGIALIGVITAALATWLIDRVREVTQDEAELTRADLRENLTGPGLADTLSSLAALHRSGDLTADEYTRAKARALSN